MTVPPYVEGDDGTGRGRVRVDAGRLWTGGLATALVAALVAVVGVLIARGCLTFRCWPLAEKARSATQTR
jgi:hypothetical protein